MKFLVINGPGLNLMQYAEPGAPAALDYDGLVEYVNTCCAQMDIELRFYQSNHEGDLIDEIQAAPGDADGIIINPCGYAFYSVAILDALQAAGLPAAEVLLEAPDEHDPVRQNDVVSRGCQCRFVGDGPDGYLRAAASLAQIISAGNGNKHSHIAM